MGKREKGEEPKNRLSFARNGRAADDFTVEELELELFKKVGAVARQLREQQGMTQGKLARRVGISQSHLCEVESGKAHMTTTTLVKTCCVLGVPLSEVIISAELGVYQVEDPKEKILEWLCGELEQLHRCWPTDV